jgi:hypothetical protein
MKNYKIINNEFGTCIILTNEDGSQMAIPTDPANSDYQAYLNPVEHLTEIPTPPVEEETI